MNLALSFLLLLNKEPLEDYLFWRTLLLRYFWGFFCGLSGAVGGPPTSNQNPATIVRVRGAPPVLLTAVHGPGGGDGVVLLLQEAPGQAAVGLLVFPALLQPRALGLLVVPHLHAQRELALFSLPLSEDRGARAAGRQK